MSQWIVAVLIAAAAAGGVWWWIGRGEARPSQEARHSREARPKAERPNTASVQQQDWMPRGGVEAAPAATTSQQAAMAAKGAPAANDEVVWRQVTTNSDGVVTEKYRTADGKSHRVIRHPRRVFKNASDQLIAMAISASKQGGSMPPLPLTDATEKDFLDSLMQPIVLNDDDPPDVKELKRDVAAVREQLVDMVKGGMTVKQALIEHQKAVNSNADFRGDALEKLAEVQAEGDREMTEEFRKRINEEFEKRGMAPVENRRKKQ